MYNNNMYDVSLFRFSYAQIFTIFRLIWNTKRNQPVARTRLGLAGQKTEIHLF